MLADRLKLLSGMLMSIFTPAKGKSFSHLDRAVNCEGIRLAPFVRNLIVWMGQWHITSVTLLRQLAEKVIRPHIWAALQKPSTMGLKGQAALQPLTVTGKAINIRLLRDRPQIETSATKKTLKAHFILSEML